MCLAFGAPSALLVASTVAGGDNAPPTWFTIVWLVAVTWNAYLWLIRIAAELTLDGNTLKAASPFRTRNVTLADLVTIRPGRFASRGVVIEVVGERPILTLATKGFREFTDEVARRRPNLPIRLGWQARLAEKMPGRSRVKNE